MNRRRTPSIVTDAELDRTLHSLRDRARLLQAESAQMRAETLSRATEMPLPGQPGLVSRVIVMLIEAGGKSEHRPTFTRSYPMSISVPHHFNIDRYGSRWLLLNAF